MPTGVGGSKIGIKWQYCRICSARFALCRVADRCRREKTQCYRMKKRRRSKQTDLLEDRLSAQAIQLREEAKALKPGAERKALLKRARQAEVAAEMVEWLRPVR